MLHDLWSELSTWWIGLTPEFTFLLTLPFLVGAAGFLSDALRRRSRARRLPVQRSGGECSATMPSSPAARG